jgi:hypothetical protein
MRPQQYVEDGYQLAKPLYVAKLNAVYFTIPKAACSAVKDAIRRTVPGWHPFADGVRQTKQWVAMRRAEDPKLFCFTVVRNPYARLVSCWADRARRQFKKFEDFTRLAMTKRLESNVHYAPQWRFISLGDERLVDIALPVERLDDAWPWVQEKLELPDLKVINQSKHRPYQENYTDELRSLARNYYADDVHRLGYAFDGFREPRWCGMGA